MRNALARLVVLTLSFATCGSALGAELLQRPDLVTGSLKNGLKYVVLNHATPPGRANVWMHVSSGSINETEVQRGLAHFLEHMAFNGSKHFEKNDVVAFFESIGLTFGVHQNAFTSFDQTTYQLSLPDNKPETLGKAFTFFSDVLYNLSLNPDAIDGERQIILEEKRRGMGADQRIFDYTFPRMLPGSRIAQRLPIGTDETISAVTRQNFLDYYTTWYRPANTTVFVVADMDPTDVVNEIAKAFDNGETAVTPTDLPGEVTPYTAPIGIVATDPEQKQGEVEIMRVLPAAPPVLTEAQFRDDLIDTLATMSFNRRVAKRVREGEDDFLRGGAGVGDLFRSFRQVTASATGEPEKWQTILEDLATEVKRGTMYGFDATEIADAKETILAFADRSADSEPTSDARRLIAQMNFTAEAGEPIQSAAQRRDLMHTYIPTITDDEVNARFKDLFDSENVAFLVTLPAGDNVPTDDQVRDLGLSYLRATPEPLQFTAKPTSILTSLPTPGTIVETSTDEPTTVETAWLSNGVAAHYRFMDYKKDNATITITLSGGEIEEKPGQRGITDMAALPFNEPASRSRSASDLDELKVGKKVSVFGGSDRDTLTLRISGDPDDLETGMQIAYLLLTEPLVDEVKAKQWVTRTNQGIDERKSTPAGVAFEEMSKLVSPPGEERLRQLEHADVARLNVADAQAWIDRIVRTAPIEVAVVGDIEESRAMDLVKTYLGSLPSRERMSPESLASLRTIQRPVGPLMIDETISTKTPVAMVMVGCFGPDQTDVDDRRLLNMASRILNTRMIKRIREQEQLVYGIGVRVTPGAAYKGYGMISAGATTEPQKATRLAEVVNEMMVDFATSGPTDDEMHIVRGQLANTLDEQMREPSYWESGISDLILRQTDLDDLNAGIAPYDAFTAEQVRDVIARYYNDDARFAVIVRPDVTAQASEPAHD